MAAPTLTTATPPLSFASLLLQFLTIVTTRRDLDLRFDLVDSSVDLLRVTTTFDDRRVVFRRDDASCTAEV